MDVELYQRWHAHPIRDLLRRAAAQDHIYDDQIEDLRLPPRLGTALRQAIARLQNGQEVPAMGPGSADDLSAELVSALPPHHETREQHEERRAAEGDASALANVRAREEAAARLAERVMRGG